MDILGRIKDFFISRKPLPLDQWFFVSFDKEQVLIRATPPGKQAWEQSFLWSSVVQVCFKDEGLWQSDGLYLFTSLRPESFVIPTEANGGNEFFEELITRGLFPAEIAIKAASSTGGELVCWPTTERTKQST